MPEQFAIDQEFDDPRHPWIANTVEGLTFADVGGLLYTVKEKLSVAWKAGAAETSLVDLTPTESFLWSRFHERCEKLGISGYKTRVADVMSDEPENELGVYDFVHCAGVIYHVADLFRFMRNISRITNKYLILGCMVIPEVIENEHGCLKSYEPICVPLLRDESKIAILHAYFNKMALKIPNMNGVEMPWIQPDFGTNYTPWWWLLTENQMISLVELYGFEVIDTAHPWEGRSSAIFCRKV